MNKHENVEMAIKSFDAIPYASIASNEPYAVGASPEQSGLRAKISSEYIEDPVAEWPEFNYPKLDGAELIHSERLLQKLLNELDTLQGPSAEVNVMYDKIAAKLAEVYRHLEVVRGLGRTGLRRELSRDRAGEMTLELFGRPDQATFNDMLYADIQAARISDDDPTSQAATIRAEFLDLIGEKAKSYAPESDTLAYELKDETIATLRRDFYNLFPGLEMLRVNSAEENVITPQESLATFKQALDATGLSDSGWDVEPGEGKAASTNDATQRIVVGKNRPNFNRKTITSVPIHEWMHAMRAHNAKNQEQAVRRMKMPGYLQFEEGFGMALEQIVTGEKRIGGTAYYLSLGLQLGMDEGAGQKRSFKDTYEIMWRRSLLTKDTVTDQDIERAKKTAIQQVTRTTRGGSLDARDISYAEGARKAHTWLNSIAEKNEPERQRLLQWALSGKFDPTDPSHVEIFTDK